MWLPLTRPPLGTWPPTQACALTGNLLVPKPALNPKPHQPGPHSVFKPYLACYMKFVEESALTFNASSHFLATCHRTGGRGRWHFNGDTAPQDLCSTSLVKNLTCIIKESKEGKLTCISTARGSCHTGLRHHGRIPSNTQQWWESTQVS